MLLVGHGIGCVPSARGLCSSKYKVLRDWADAGWDEGRGLRASASNAGVRSATAGVSFCCECVGHGACVVLGSIYFHARRLLRAAGWRRATLRTAWLQVHAGVPAGRLPPANDEMSGADAM